MDGNEYITIPHPIVAPLGFKVNAEMVKEVWDIFVQTETVQSVQARVLMGILSAVYEGLITKES